MAEQVRGVAHILTDFVSPLPTGSRQHLIDSLATLVYRYGRPELAARLHTVTAPTPEHETEDGQMPRISPNGTR
ncbi:hypothetical protein OG735_40660 [Streptomyces sp. NBC_01210]|uniref:hypothetical protein n=1 Tax=Streptomyces sp. NBC_01210 TaxID=2903774 RepID=UPI002E116866|nr:hypothetical protein OG735_40660 [Streptomyces sp. NBC_01210]